MSSATGNLSNRDRSAILKALSAGVTPRRGFVHIQVGRKEEIEAITKDIQLLKEGGTTVRFIIGEFGSGKSFFLQFARMIAYEMGLVTVHADLSPDRRLFGAKGSGTARNLYNELMMNMATTTRRDGKALESVLERFIKTAKMKAEERDTAVDQVIQEQLGSLLEMVKGYDFVTVIRRYWEGVASDNEQLKEDAIRWLRGEFATKTEVKQSSLRMNSMIEDAEVYDILKLMSRFVWLAGYHGFFVVLDEMVNLYKLSNTKSRTSNYEQILRILNDCLQGSAERIGFLFGGTLEFMFDTRKGLYSYEALRSRLSENVFAKAVGVRDLSGPVITLDNLMAEDLYVLLERIRAVFAYSDESKFLVPNEALDAFLNHCKKTIGDSYFRTPRNTIRAFVQLLSVLEANPDLKCENLIGETTIEKEVDANQSVSDMLEDEEEDDFATFKL